MTRPVLSFAFVAALSSAALSAHHSIAAVYDASRQVTVNAVVTQFHFVYPHPFVTADVKDANGATGSWLLEMDNRRELESVGMTADTMKAGDRIIASGSPSLKQPNSLYVRRLDRPADRFRYEQIGTSPRIGVIPR
jgi:Family of unknown function (DUF6152)